MAVFAITFSFNIYAQASRTFVSTTGNDANTAAGCSAGAPCRTFTGALSVTSSGGEVVVLTSGAYGPAAISQAVTITAIGVDASISVTTSGADGLDIYPAGNVTLIGLSLHGEATGEYGIEVTQVGFLRLYNMLIENFTMNGVLFLANGNLEIYGSEFNDFPQIGIYIDNASASVYVKSTSFENNNVGLNVSGGQAVITDSSAEFNNVAFGATGGGTLSLFNSRVISNNIGLDTVGGRSFIFANCLIADNGMAYFIDTGSTMTGTGTSLITPRQMTYGTLSAPIPLQ